MNYSSFGDFCRLTDLNNWMRLRRKVFLCCFIFFRERRTRVVVGCCNIDNIVSSADFKISFLYQFLYFLSTAEDNKGRSWQCDVQQIWSIKQMERRQLNHWNCLVSVFLSAPELFIFYSIQTYYHFTLWHWILFISDIRRTIYWFFMRMSFTTHTPAPAIFIKSIKGNKKIHLLIKRRNISVFPCVEKDDEWIKHMCLCVCLEPISHSPNIDFIVIKCK